MPGIGSLGPGCSPQQALESLVGSASSVVMISSPSCWYAGDFTMRGTHTERKWSIDVSPPALLPVASGPLQGASCPSLQRLGVMNEKLRVVDRWCRSCRSFGSGTTRFLHAPESRTEWKYTNGLCRAAYWSLAVAD